MDLTRRRFVQGVSGGLLAAGLGPLWLAPRSATGAASEPLLVVVFLRGAADALHLVPPLRDPGYAKLRGPLALAEPLPFTDAFGLHPALAPAAGLVAKAQLAAVVNAGSPHPTRSHFEAQDFMEAGEPGTLRLRSGWLARALGPTPDAHAFETVALAQAQPLTLRGSGAFALGGAFGIPGASAAARRELRARYAKAGGELGRAGVRALDALTAFERTSSGRQVRGGRRAPFRLADAAARLVELGRAGLPVRAAFLESSGWDTHRSQGADRGALANLAGDLGGALARLERAFGERRDWLCVVLTEFGRTVRPNGSGGTDHGHGSALLVAGPRVRGGVYGEWKGLVPANLYEGRDLPVTTDFRHVLFEVLRAHLGRDPAAGTFPAFAPRPLGLLA